MCCVVGLGRQKMAFFARYSLSRHFWRQETTVTKEKGRSKESSTMAVCGVLRFLSLVSDDLLTLATICVQIGRAHV